MFCLFYDAKTKKVHAMNGSGRSGEKVTLEQIRKDLKIPDGQNGQIPMNSVHAVTVPGAAAGWVDCVERFGSGNRLPRAKRSGQSSDLQVGHSRAFISPGIVRSNYTPGE